MTSSYNYFPFWRATGWVIVVGIVVLSLTPQQPNIGGFEMNDKLGHALVYALGMGWFAALYPDTPNRVRYAAFFIALGIALEFAQAFTPYRQFDFIDMLVDVVGVAAGFMIGQPVLQPLDRAMARLFQHPRQ